MKNLRIGLVLALSLATTSGCSVLYPNFGKPTDSPSPSSSATQTPTVTPSPSETPTVDPAKQGANVEIMDAYVDTQNSSLQVIAQITNFSEDGGNCIATLTSGGKSNSVTVTAESNASNTQCRMMEFALGNVAKGSARLIVKYESTTHSGLSQEMTVAIP